MYLIRGPFSWGDEMRYIEAGQPRRTYGGAAVTTILDFFREVVGPEDDDAPPRLTAAPPRRSGRQVRDLPGARTIPLN